MVNTKIFGNSISRKHAPWISSVCAYNLVLSDQSNNCSAASEVSYSIEKRGIVASKIPFEQLIYEDENIC